MTGRGFGGRGVRPRGCYKAEFPVINFRWRSGCITFRVTTAHIFSASGLMAFSTAAILAAPSTVS